MPMISMYIKQSLLLRIARETSDTKEIQIAIKGTAGKSGTLYGRGRSGSVFLRRRSATIEII